MFHSCSIDLQPSIDGVRSLEHRGKGSVPSKLFGKVDLVSPGEDLSGKGMREQQANAESTEWNDEGGSNINHLD